MPSGENRPFRVFVSSTFIDNQARRKIVEDAILSAGLVPVGMERFTASTRPTVEECEEQVRGCDWLIGILAYRYGWIPSGQERSITEMEYDAAKEQGMPRLMFVLDSSVKVDPNADFDHGPDRWKKQEKLDAFKAKIGADQMPAVFREDNLGTRVLQAIFDERTRQTKQRAGRQQGAAASSKASADDDDDSSPVPTDELRRYLAKAKSLHEYIPLIGFKTKTRLSMQLNELYVPLDAVIDRGGRGCEVYASAEVAELSKTHDAVMQREEISLANAFDRARAMKRHALVLLGDPGSGKTTHLEQVLLKVVRDGPESIGLPPGTVPVFLSLRKLEDREAGLPAFIHQELRGPALNMKPDFGQRLCERGKLLLLLDGLDEVASAEERAEVARWIEAARTDMPESHILVSCRYAGYSGEAELDPHFLELHLRPFNDEQMRTFVTNWYATVEHEQCADPGQADVRAERGAKELLELLEGSEFTSVGRFYEMTRNPLLLTTLCLVHHDLGRLPHARAKLYEESIAVLLERWRHRTTKGVLPLSADEAVGALQPVAKWMHEERRTRGTTAELTEPVGKGLAKLRHVQMSAKEFLQAIRDESGLLTGWGMDEFGFMHLGFQEFLTAQRLRNEGLKNPRVFEVLAGQFGDSWWQEVILLMLAQHNPSVFEEFMGAVVRQSDFASWAGSETMALALTEAVDISAAPFVEFLRSAGKEAGEERLLAVAQMLVRVMPEALEGLEGVLREHPLEGIRRWWRVRTEGSGCDEGEIIVAPRGGVELVRIPAGRFLMGSSDSEDGRNVYSERYVKTLGFHPESPQHEVELASFYLARTSVTNTQYGKYLKANPEAEKPEYWGNRKYNQPEQPVVGVSWHEARAYCEWAGLLLPTEAQWEYACRAGSETRYHLGNSEEDLARVGWYGGNSDGRLHAVGELAPNDFGLHDMHGNVWEWCGDGFGSYETNVRPKDGLRHEPEAVADRVLRGGCFFHGAGDARSAIRFGDGPGERNLLIGFRPAQGID